MSERHLTAWEHVDELRAVLIRSLAAIAVGFFICLFFYESIYQVLTAPLHNMKVNHAVFVHEPLVRERIHNTSDRVHYYQQQPIPPGSYIDVDVVAKPKLVVLSPLEGMIMTFKICVWLGIVIASPLWIYFVLQFVLPALTLEEKRMIVPFLSLSALFILLGFVSAYHVTVPLANAYLFGFNQEFALNLWTLSSYLNYTLFLMIANGAACEIGVILFMLVHYRIINAEAMRAYRKHMIVAAFIIAALLTPPDVLTQFMMAIPLIVFYELAILYAQFRQPYANPLPQLTRSDS